MRNRLVHGFVPICDAAEFTIPNEPAMAEQIVITEKTSQAKDVRARRRLALRRHSCRPRAICSTCSSRRRWCRPGSAGRRSCCGLTVFTAPARRKAATRPPSSRPFARRCAAPSGSGSPPIATAKGQLIGQEILEHYRLSRRGDAGAVHRAGPADHPRCLRPGKAERRICPPLRRRGRAPAGRPDLQSVADPHRDRHAGSRRAPSDRRRPGQDADLGHRLQARTGNPRLRARWPISRWSPPRKSRAASSRCAMRRRSGLSGASRPQDVVDAAEGFAGPLAVRVEDKRQGAAQAARSAVAAETLRLALRLVGQQDARSGAGTL